MTEPVLTATRHRITPEMTAHPLATQSGLAMLQHLIEGDRVWSRCTPVQRRLLDGLCRPVITQLLERGELHAEDLPELPAEVRSSTRGSLSAAGLIDIRDRITGKAVHAWYWAVGFKERDAAEGDDNG